MMRKAQDRAGLHGGLGGLQGIKGLAGFGSTLASNKFVRAAIREEVSRATLLRNEWCLIILLCLSLLNEIDKGES